VLDSSFNPPTMAHLALARLSLSSSQTHAPASRTFDAKLLLFSIKNADKTLKQGDATPTQRLEMMVLLARELEAAGGQGSQSIAVAVCQEPTFVGKSTALTLFFRDRLAAFSSSATVQLTFLLGFDTLERLFAPRYYGSESAMKGALRVFFSPSGDNSRTICARRSSGVSYSEADTSVLGVAAEFIDSGAVELVDIGEEERALSSSEVRENIGSTSDVWYSKVPKAVATYIQQNTLYRQSSTPPA